MSPARFLASLALVLSVLIGAATTPSAAQDEAPQQLSVLFLGDGGAHRPADRFRQIAPVLEERNIALTYTESLADVRLENLQKYDALLVFANIDRIDPDAAQGLLDYVAGGGGFVPIHCASFCFRNSPEVVALIGAQFQRHGTGVFTTQITEPDHPIMRGFGGFESWDETYVHHLHNEKDRTVLSYRVDGDEREPWTWVRTHGDGRVFYTAWGHDHRTWGNEGFQNLLERGIRWAADEDVGAVPDYQSQAAFPVPEMTPKRTDIAAFEYVDVGAKIPNYPPSRQWGRQDEPLNMMQKPLPPAESIKHFVTPVGFHVELFASEPDFQGKPIYMTWDERGRLWVCETVDYPNELARENEGRDRIRICEDTDGDGRADKFTVFAEGLSIPTAIAFHRGGAIVQNARETLYLKDTDGDDRADERRVLFSGWSIGDTHGIVSNFNYGLDNWIWAMQGYNNSRPVAADGTRYPGFRQGFFRFRPDGSDIEFLRSTNNNTWGLGISEEGIVFGSTANRCPSVYMPIPNRYYERVAGWSPQVLQMISEDHLFDPITEKVRQVDQHGGYTAGAGKALYTARAYPQEYWNRVSFVNGPTGHLVGAFVLNRDGSDFTSDSPFNLLASDDEWSAPIMAEVGPDGHVWVIDWYNFIVQHNPTPAGFDNGRGNAYETDLRDKAHGRVYRVVYDKAPEAEPMSLAGASPEELVQALAHDNLLWRRHAQRLLVERGENDVVPALIALVKDQSVDPIGLNVGAIHALWTLQGLGALDRSNDEATQAAIAALAHPSAGVRRNAVQVLPPGEDSLQAVLDSKILADDDAQVRLAAVLALADVQEESDNAAKTVADQLKSPGATEDRWIADALTSAAAVHAPRTLAYLADAQQLDERTLEIVTTVAEHVARSRPDGQQIGRLLAALDKADPVYISALATGLSEGWPRDHTAQISDEAAAALGILVERIPSGTQGQLIRLGNAWGTDVLEKYADRITSSLVATLSDQQQATRSRVEAAEQLVEFLPRDAKVVGQVLDQVTPQATPELAEGLIEALGGSTAEGLGGAVIERLAGMTPAVRSAALRVLLTRPETTRDLLTAAADGAVQLSDLSLDQQQALAAHPDRRIRRRASQLLEQGGSLPNPDRAEVLARLMPLTERTGDAALGKQVFIKECSKCHTHSGEGTVIGPDLTGMAVHPKEELLTHIIDPSRSVEANFRTYTVVTLDGLIQSGMLASETRTSIELIDTEAKRHAIVRDDIDQLLASNKSVMPEGFEKQVTEDDIANLLEFLTSRGRYTPLDLRKVASISSVRGMFFDERSTAERLIFSDWSPKTYREVPFQLVDPQDGRVPNVVMLYGPQGEFPPRMPREVSLPVHQPARAIHLLSGVAGWAAQGPQEDGTVSMIVRIVYQDGQTEDHELRNGVHFADYIGRYEVPGSELAFRLRNSQVRYLAVEPKRTEPIDHIELVKGPDATAPLVVAVTVEAPQ